jgi:hypothetical protein
MVLIIAFYLLISPHFLGGTRTSTQGFTLARQVLYFLSHTSNPFCSCYFGGRVSIFAQAGLDCDPILHFTGMTDAQDHSWLFYIEMGSQVCLVFFFLSGLAWNCDPSNLSLLCSWDDRQELLCPGNDWDEVLWTIFLGWPQTSGLPIHPPKAPTVILPLEWGIGAVPHV